MNMPSLYFTLCENREALYEPTALFEICNVALAYTPHSFGRLAGPDGEFVKGSFVPLPDFLRLMFKHLEWKYPRQLVDDAGDAGEQMFSRYLGRFSMTSQAPARVSRSP